MHHEGEIRGIVFYRVLGFHVQSGNLCLTPWYWDLIFTQIMPKKSFLCRFGNQMASHWVANKAKILTVVSQPKKLCDLWDVQLELSHGAAGGGGFLHCSGNVLEHKIWSLRLGTGEDHGHSHVFWCVTEQDPSHQSPCLTGPSLCHISIQARSTEKENLRHVIPVIQGSQVLTPKPYFSRKNRINAFQTGSY